jgi:hypothetical protein
MRKMLLLAVLPLAMLGVLVVPVAAAQVPTQDSVTGTGVVAGGSGATFTFDIDAHSGPSGENPTGQVTFRSASNGSVFFSGPVTCLAVNGNSAILNIDASQFGPVNMEVTDSPSGDRIRAIAGHSTPCTPLASPLDFLLISGGVVVVDAPAVPTSKDQCKNGGWHNFPGFKNEGDCVSFVATGGKSPTQDSVTGQAQLQSPRFEFNFSFDAHSGPSGKQPSGTVNGAPVTCLNVSGNQATIGAGIPSSNALFFVQDNDGAGQDRIGVEPFLPTPVTVCPDPALISTTLPSFPITSGDITVVDAHPSPPQSASARTAAGATSPSSRARAASAASSITELP